MENKEKKALMIASYLLQYPDSNWREALEEAYDETVDLEGMEGKFTEFINYARTVNELEMSELYTNTFDFSKESSLNLTFYDYAEQQERGMALYKLKEKYIESGLFLINNELPDFLPLVLEFSAASEKKDVLADFYKSIKNIYTFLLKNANPYSRVFEGILALLKDEKAAGDDLNSDSCINAENMNGEAVGGNKI